MKIELKRSNVLDGTAAKPPTASQMAYGELAINYNAVDASIFLKDSDNNIIKIAGEGSTGGKPAGLTQQVQYNDAGAFGASSNFTYDKGANRLFASTVASGICDTTMLTATSGTVTNLGATTFILQGLNPTMTAPNGSIIAIGDTAKFNAGTTGDRVTIESSGISFSHLGDNPVKFSYTVGSTSQNYKVPTEMGTQSYALALTDVTTGQTGWMGVVPTGEWTDALIPPLP